MQLGRQFADGGVDQGVGLARRQAFGQQPAGGLDGDVDGAGADLGDRRLFGLGDAFDRLRLAPLQGAFQFLLGLGCPAARPRDGRRARMASASSAASRCLRS